MYSHTCVIVSGCTDHKVERQNQKHTHTTPTRVNRQTDKECAWGRPQFLFFLQFFSPLSLDHLLVFGFLMVQFCLFFFENSVPSSDEGVVASPSSTLSPTSTVISSFINSFICVYGCVFWSISLLSVYMCVRMLSSPKSIVGVPSSRALPGYLGAQQAEGLSISISSRPLSPSRLRRRSQSRHRCTFSCLILWRGWYLPKQCCLRCIWRLPPRPANLSCRTVLTEGRRTLSVLPIVVGWSEWSCCSPPSMRKRKKEVTSGPETGVSNSFF